MIRFTIHNDTSMCMVIKFAVCVYVYEPFGRRHIHQEKTAAASFFHESSKVVSYMYVCMYMYIYVCICMYIYIYLCLLHKRIEENFYRVCLHT